MTKGKFYALRKKAEYTAIFREMLKSMPKEAMTEAQRHEFMKVMKVYPSETVAQRLTDQELQEKVCALLGLLREQIAQCKNDYETAVTAGMKLMEMANSQHP